jgi:hypothetical protein
MGNRNGQLAMGNLAILLEANGTGTCSLKQKAFFQQVFCSIGRFL